MNVRIYYQQMKIVWSIHWLTCFRPQ